MPETAPSTARRPEKVVEQFAAAPLLVLSAGLWATILVVAVGITVVRFRAGTLDSGSLMPVVDGARWFAVVLGLLGPLSLLTPHVAAGGTRASFVRGTVRAAWYVGAAFGIVTFVLLLAERFLVLPALSGARPAAQVTGPGMATTLVGEALTVGAYVLVGVAVAAGYRRLGGLWGSALLVPALVPVALADVGRGSGNLGEAFRSAVPGGLPGALLATAVTAAAFAAAALLLHLLVRDIPISPAR